MNAYRITTFIFGALMMGVTSFAVIVAFLVATGTVKPAIAQPVDAAAQAGIPPLQLMAIIAALSTLSAIPLAFVLRARTLARAGSPAEANWRMAHIIAGAILEGAGLLCCVFALITGNLAFLAGTGLMLAAMGVLFPTPARAELWAAEVADLRP